jgi:type II restriction/modification system DNA methylase subunit YeeA
VQASDFIRKWRGAELTERAAAQSHFIDLCRVLDELTPSDADPKGEWYAFEKGAIKTGGGDGWADVWKRGCFAWEYKGKRKNLDEAYVQLQRYAVALENPPLLVVSDMDRFRIHTNWTNTVQEVIEFPLEELADERRRRILKQAFSETAVEVLKPGKTRQDLTEDVALKFADIAGNLRKRGNDPFIVAHFVNRMLFCMFAEDVGLLPDHMFRRMLKASESDPEAFVENGGKLFAAMRKGGRVGFEPVEWFNGGIFDDDTVLKLDKDEIAQALLAAEQDWSNIDPSIMGTLFERGLDPDKRKQLGAHYTDRDKIMMIINPVVIAPLHQEWATVRGQIEQKIERYRTHRDKSQRTAAYNDAVSLHQGFINRLQSFRILDPACGSGNFLYLALHALKDIEHKANLEAEQLGLPFVFPSVGPECVKGLELNPFAAELARVSVWIGEIQWMLRHGFSVSRKPILQSLTTIECRDALLNDDGSETEWPEADVIIGNPPFLGAKLMKRKLGVPETERIRGAFAGRLPGFTDLVCFWFEKARAQIVDGKTDRAGLVATNSISKNTNLTVMRRIAADLSFYEAWDDEPWIVDGAAVRVAIACFARKDEAPKPFRIDGAEVDRINANLTTGLDVTKAAALKDNEGCSLLGIQKSGPFDIPGDLARKWLKMPLNPNGRPNSDVLKPYWNGDDVTSGPRDMWIIDFPQNLKTEEAALYEKPFSYLKQSDYQPEKGEPPVPFTLYRQTTPSQNPSWWEAHRPRPEMRRSIERLSRYIATPETAEHRIFVWMQYPVLPDKNLIVICRDDDVTFGILHSRIHEVWSTGIGNRMGQGNQRRYNNSYIFDTFPFPDGMGPKIDPATFATNNRAQAIATAAKNLDRLRNNWLFPANIIKRVPEVVKGYPDCFQPIDASAAPELRRRNLTTLYNENHDWLRHAHEALDAAVAGAYGWPATLTDQEILQRLFDLNQSRAAPDGNEVEDD